MTNENFSEILPNEVIKEEYLSEYEEKREIIWKALIHLRTNLFILEKLQYFPFVLLSPDELIFLNSTIKNILNSSILILWNLNDKNSSSITLKNFKQEVWRHVKAEYKEEFQRVLKESRFNNNEKKIISKIEILRNKIIAHFDEKYLRSKKNFDKAEKLSFKELGKIYSSLEELFDTLCFGHEHRTLLMNYMKGETDIDKILNLIAANSHAFNLPESNPKAWDIFQKKLTKEDREKINEYRIKNGKDPI
jgi:hypothetical protein